MTDEQQRELAWLAQRAQIVLLAAQGLQNKDVAEQLGIGRVQVARWRERYLQCGLQGIERDLPRGAPPVKVDVAKLVDLTTRTTPAAATHWRMRKMAAALGVSASTVMRHWQAHGLMPHIVGCLKVSRDPQCDLDSKKTCPLLCGSAATSRAVSVRHPLLIWQGVFLPRRVEMFGEVESSDGGHLKRF